MYINIFCKRLEYEIEPNFDKDRIRPPFVIFSAYLKKITTTISSHFLGPNGQGSYASLVFVSQFILYTGVVIHSMLLKVNIPLLIAFGKDISYLLTYR